MTRRYTLYNIKHTAQSLLTGLVAVCCFMACSPIVPDDETLPDAPSTPQIPSDAVAQGEGSWESPYNVDAARTAPAEAVVGAFIYVEGYLVGYIPSGNYEHAFFGVPDEKPNTNLLLASSPSVRTASQVMPVQLPTSGGLREDFNLFDHPELLGARLVVCGTGTTYFQTRGLNPVDRIVTYEAWLDAKNSLTPGGSTTPTDPSEPANPSDPPAPPTSFDGKVPLAAANGAPFAGM